jgi:hypothetical protein
MVLVACLVSVHDAFIIQEKLAPTGINSRFLFNTRGVFRLFTKDVVPVQDILVYNSTNVSTESIYMGDLGSCSMFDSEV